MSTLYGIEKFLQLTTVKTETHTKNIASADIPDYQAQDIASPANFAELVSKSSSNLSMAVTSNMHIPSKRKESSFKTKRDKDAKETKPNGNNVNVTQQLYKLSKSQTEHNVALRAYANMVDLAKIALGKGGA